MKEIRCTLNIPEHVVGLEPVIVLEDEEWNTLYNTYWKNHRGTARCSQQWGDRGVLNILVSCCHKRSGDHAKSELSKGD